MRKRNPLLLSLTIVLLLPGVRAHAADEVGTPTTYEDQAFWKHWSDGKAELNGYELTYPRYNFLTKGTAVTIFVKEDFAHDEGVKYDGRVPSNQTTPVMKLNLVQDFTTGIYDYNLMTSVFSALKPVANHPAGTPLKVSFGAQEWCGHAYSQIRFIGDAIKYESHSYFSGEADRTASLDTQADDVTEDALLLWARGMSGPLLQPGESKRLSLLTSLETARLRHKPLGRSAATLVGASSRREVTVPAGTFDVDVYSVLTIPKAGVPMPDAQTGKTWRFYVEHAFPHRIVKWTATDGRVAELTGSTRLPYWQLHGPGHEQYLKELGLKPRPARTP